MKLTINLKLMPNKEQAGALLATLERANAACNYAAAVAWNERVFGQFKLHRLIYYELKSRFELSAQMAVRALAKVADAYKPDHKTRRTFRPHGAISYDERILNFKSGDAVSIWTLSGRQVVAFVCGDYQRRLLPYRKGEVDLLYVRGLFYLSVVCDIAEPTEAEATEFLGIDLGIINIATDSDGNVYSGAKVELDRRVFAHRRRNLQRRATRAARRKLRQIKGKQARFQKDANHCISKAVVETAKRTGRGIALEDLGGIRDRVTARRRQRARLANWAFEQLRFFVEYKARLAGVAVVAVDPRNTSRTCPVCGCIDKANRKTQSQFLCVSCGHSGPADHVAARNIRARAAVNQPMVSSNGTAATQMQAPAL